MGKFLYYNYIAGIFMFLIDRLFFRTNRTEEQEKQSELELEESLYDLEMQSNYLFGTDSFVRSFCNKIMKLRDKEWSKQLIVFIIFQIPAINIYVFADSFKEKFIDKEGD